MNHRIRTAIAALAVTPALALAACGDSNGTSNGTGDKTVAGVRAAYVDMNRMAADGKGQQACDRYFTVSARQLAEAFGGCGRLLEESAHPAVRSGNLDVSIKGNRATYVLRPDRPGDDTVDSGKAVWTSGGWRFDIGD